jgi:hypothetical protein
MLSVIIQSVGVLNIAAPIWAGHPICFLNRHQQFEKLEIAC